MAFEIPIIDYDDLNLNDKPIENIIQKIQEIGAVAITNIPNFENPRLNALSQIYKFGKLPENIKDKYSDSESKYSFGWSYGKEKLKENELDTNKGSFYFNINDYSKEEYNEIKNEIGLNKHYGSNLWPIEELPEMRGKLLELSGIIYNVALKFIKTLDNFLAKNLKDRGYKLGTLLQLITNSKIHKARGLVYFPPIEKADTKWCNEHFDHSIITGLVSAMYIKDDIEITNPDPNCGLYIRDHCNIPHKINIKKNELLFQFGETMHIITGGLIKATSHWVTPPIMEINSNNEIENIFRITLAIFFSPNLDVRLQGLKDSIELNGWSPGMTFGEFSNNRIMTYYD